MSWTFRYIAIRLKSGHFSITMERDHHYDDEVTGQRMEERIPAGVITLTEKEWFKLRDLLYGTICPEGFEYEVHEELREPRL